MTSRYGQWETGAVGLGYLESSTLWGKSLQYLLRADCVDLSTRINLEGHQLSAITGRKLKSGIKGYCAVGHNLSVHRKPLGWAMVLMLSASMTLMLS